MKKLIIPIMVLCTISLLSCSKDDDNNDGNPSNNLAITEQAAAEDFGNNIAMPVYTDLDASATDLNTKIHTLVVDPTDANLASAQTAWRNMRTIWETSEGFLFGPVEDNDYDPQTDTWPTDFAQMDSLLASSNALQPANIEALDYTLRGYHPIEYMLWGKNSSKKAADFTARENQYIVALADDLQSICAALHNEWADGYLTQVITAGRTSTDFTTYHNFFTTLNNGMIDICNEVGKSDEGDEGKIFTPFALRDSNLVESPYSENSMIDFKNNITGAYNVYIGKYEDQKTGLSNIVQLYNKDLDNKIKQKFQAAISSFSNVNVSFEKAIYEQRDQLQLIMTAIADVRSTLQGDLQNFINTNIKN